MNNYDNYNNSDWHSVLGTEDMSRVVRDAAMYRMIYPEVYYKLQPYVVMMCDEMDVYGAAMPTPEMLEHMCNRIYDDVCHMYPEYMEYMEHDDALETIQANPFGNPIGYRRGYRRNNIFRDLISILLLSEFFGRRRRYRW